MVPQRGSHSQGKGPRLMEGIAASALATVSLPVRVAQASSRTGPCSLAPVVIFPRGWRRGHNAPAATPPMAPGGPFSGEVGAACRLGGCRAPARQANRPRLTEAGGGSLPSAGCLAVTQPGTGFDGTTPKRPSTSLRWGTRARLRPGLYGSRAPDKQEPRRSCVSDDGAECFSPWPQTYGGGPNGRLGHRRTAPRHYLCRGPTHLVVTTRCP